ncbi:SI1L3 protein, partial [Upupa epops]|nr:SI1L3 protein [Upupa epops]
MGVRARIAEWPPKRDPTPPTTGASGSPRGPPGSHHQPLKALHRLARRRSKDVEFHHDPWPRATGLGLRQRSSSEVTLSECDPEEAAATGSAVEQPRAANPSGLFREYGSTSSIDVQGLSEQSFLEMLNQFRANKGLGAVAHTNETVAHGKEKTRWRSPKGTGAAASGTGDADSIFKKLRSIRSEAEAAKEPEEAPRPWLCQKSFAHYDVQSLLFDLNAVMVANRATVAAQRRRNTTTGASAASVGTGGQPGGSETPVGGHEELNQKENLEHDGGDNQSNELLLSCPHFRNEIGGAAERDLGFARATAGTATAGPAEVAAGFPDGRPSNAGVNVLEGAGDAGRSRGFSLEHEDLGARYYREHFHGKEHSNYFGLDEKLGPVAISIKRE